MKYFFSKLLLFLFVVLLVQKEIEQIHPFIPPLTIENLQIYQRSKKDIIYFGDSTTTWYSIYDTDIRSTQTMLGSIVTNHSIGAVAHDSYHAGMYDAYTSYMQQHQYNPSYIIVPINLRSFSINWDLNSSSQFTDEMLYLHFYHTPLGPFLTFILNMTLPEVKRLYENIYAFAPEYDGKNIVGNGGDFENIVHTASIPVKRKAMFQMDYLASLNPNHNKIHELVAIAQKYRKTKTKVIFYITPIDYQSGNAYFGSRFAKQVKENTQTIITQLKRQGSDVLDLSFALTSPYFIWKEEGYVNEHINSKGRFFVAKILASRIYH